MEVLKDTVGFAVEVTNQIKEALEDGKIGIWEIAALAGRAVGIARIIKNRKEMVAELKALTPEKQAELDGYIKNRFPALAGKAEQTVAEVLTIVAQLAHFSLRIAEIWDKK